ncbi:hypothetical protein FQN54_009059 [Arachnomyces sp. PD_36]|nr:hypothetical protein FQN54_009059 [Arachnomyces sp. PD_36]
MSVGTLKAKIVLPARLICGPNEPVKGKVEVRYQPFGGRPAAELFGPVVISIFYYARLKTKMKWGKEDYRARVQLYRRTLQLYEGPIRIKGGEVREYPFEFPIPQQVDSPAGVFNCWKRDDAGFDLDPAQPLPPSMAFARIGFNSDGEAYIEHKVGALLNMPNINVATQASAESTIRYERPRMITPVAENPATSRGWLFVKDKCLIPEEDRPNPQGFKEKTASMFQVVHRPFCKFKWAMTAPKHFHRGQQLLLKLRVEPMKEECTAPVLPMIKLQSVTVRIIAHIDARTEVHIINEPRYSGENEVISRSVRGDGFPFNEVNDWTRVIVVKDVTNLPSSFRTVCIGQKYTMKITARLSIAGRYESVKGQWGVTIHPPLAEGPVGDQEPSTDAIQPVAEDESGLPAYEPGELPPTFKEATK